ncbi:hypothetical protein AAHE18_12G102500 [Arachis hypogaea]
MQRHIITNNYPRPICIQLKRSLYQSIISEVIQVNKKLASCYFQVILSLSLFNFNKNSLQALLETLNTGSYYGNVSHCPHNFRILYAPYYAIYGKRISFYLKIKFKKIYQNKTYRVLPHGIFILLSTSKLNVHAYNNTYHVLSEDVYIIIYLLLHSSLATGLSC